MDVIESVERVGHRVRIVCGGETLYVGRRLYRERPLQPGEPIELKEYEDWLLEHQYPQALDCAVSMLAQRACATEEIRRRLTRAGYRPQTVEMVLYKLSSNALLDDADFARQWVQARSGRGLGAGRIARELRQKGVTAEDAEAALEEINEETQQENALRLAKKGLLRAKPGEDRRRTEQRVMAQLARRGYGYAEAREAIAQARAEE